MSFQRPQRIDPRQRSEFRRFAPSRLVFCLQFLTFHGILCDNYTFYLFSLIFSTAAHTCLCTYATALPGTNRTYHKTPPSSAAVPRYMTKLFE